MPNLAPTDYHIPKTEKLCQKQTASSNKHMEAKQHLTLDSYFILKALLYEWKWLLQVIFQGHRTTRYTKETE
jgi:hypothetical protein